jgi:hypothetical protein
MKETVHIKCYQDGKQIEIAIEGGYSYKGLALHHTVGPDGESLRTWTVTHLHSGLVLKKQLKGKLSVRLGFLREMANLADWTLPFDDVSKHLFRNREKLEEYKRLLSI